MSKKKLTNNEFAKIMLKENQKWILKSQYQGKRTDIDIECSICGFQETVNERALHERVHRCKNCEGYRGITFGVDDFYTKFPDIAKLAKDQELVHKIAPNSHKSIDFICPICHKINSCVIANVVRSGFHCQFCSNSYSYPNKFMGNILQQLNINFEREYSPEWIKPCRYDFMFYVHNCSYIIEMDGWFHSADNKMNGMTKEEAERIDRHKDVMAKKYGFIMIRIDCNYKDIRNRYEYIINNILKSKLNSIFDFNLVDFHACDKIAQQSELSTICKLYDSGIYNIRDLSKMVGLQRNSIISYLQKSEELHCSTYCHENAMCERNEQRKAAIGRNNGDCVLCIETNEIFYSIACAKHKYGGNIEQYLQGRADYAGTSYDGVHLHWKIVDDADLEKYMSTNRYTFFDVDFGRDKLWKYNLQFSNIVKCNETNEYFFNINIARSYYRGNISHYFMGDIQYAGKLNDGTKLTWTKLSITDSLQYISNGGFIIKTLNSTK